jgi:phosphatidate phosphatase APP1
MKTLMIQYLAVGLCGLISVSVLANEKETREKTMSKQEYVTFYPTYGYRDGDNWRIPLRVWVHEHDGWFGQQLSKLSKRVVRNKAGLEQLNTDQQAMFRMRFQDFVADSESFEAVHIRFDDDPDNEVIRLKSADGDKRTDFNGLLLAEITLGQDRAHELLAAQNSQDGWLTFQAVGKDHIGSGRLQLIPPIGHSVISDIDDTLKITEITEGEAVVMMNTFFKPFQPVPQMQDLFKTFNDAAFHYVSGGPWQMFEPLSAFLFSEEVGFPRGSVHMKNVRLHLLEGETYGDFYRLIKLGSLASEQQKIRQISEILSHFPQREFTLIGDSGEHDPEVFAHIRNEFPGQVKTIMVRDVINDAKNNPKRFHDMQVIQADSAFIGADG